MPFAPAEPPGGLSLLPFAQRAICVRGVARGFPGDVPPVHMRALPAACRANQNSTKGLTQDASNRNFIAMIYLIVGILNAGPLIA